MKTNKYKYFKVIQQHFGQGWEDVSVYTTNSQFKVQGQVFETLKSGRQIELCPCSLDLIEYKLQGYPTRVINRKQLA